MIAMQYNLVLPADYDMSIIDRRIAERGHLTDGFPGLAFKAYLHARKQGSAPSASDNLYAPFYLWNTTEGMNEFLCGSGFVGLTQSFGWPSVHTWSVWHAQVSADVGQARFATRELMSIAPYTDLAGLKAAESERSMRTALTDGIVATLAGFDPTGWNAVRFQLWTEAPDAASMSNSYIYTVGHVSTER